MTKPTISTSSSRTPRTFRRTLAIGLFAASLAGCTSLTAPPGPPGGEPFGGLFAGGKEATPGPSKAAPSPSAAPAPSPH